MHLPWRLVNPASLAEIAMPGYPGYTMAVPNIPELQWMVKYAASLDLPHPVPTSLTVKEARLLARLAKGGKVLEVGSSYGFSTIVMAQVADHVDAVDPHPELAGLSPGTLAGLQSAVKEYSVADRITVIRDFSYNVLPEMARQSYDLIFVDAHHEEESVAIDAELVRDLVKPGGYLAFHDYAEDWCPGVAQAVDRVLGPGGKVTDTLWVRQAKKLPEE